MLPLGNAIDEGDLDAALGPAVDFHASIAVIFEAPAQILQAPAQIREVIVAIVGGFCRPAVLRPAYGQSVKLGNDKGRAERP